MKSKFIKKVSSVILFTAITSVSTAFASFGDVNLKYGSQGNDVVVLQQKLNSLGYWCEADGIFGSWTQKKVLDFQADYNIKTTGVVGTVTSQRLLQLTGVGHYGYAEGGKIIKTAETFLGVPYVWGGETPAGFDCSGFTQYVMHKNGIDIPRTAAEQFAVGKSIARSGLQIGDLVFFTTYKSGASHVGFYIGDNQFIHASSANHKVTISSLSDDYYNNHYIGARRFTN